LERKEKTPSSSGNLYHGKRPGPTPAEESEAATKFKRNSIPSKLTTQATTTGRGVVLELKVPDSKHKKIKAEEKEPQTRTKSRSVKEKVTGVYYTNAKSQKVQRSARAFRNGGTCVQARLGKRRDTGRQIRRGGEGRPWGGSVGQQKRDLTPKNSQTESWTRMRGDHKNYGQREKQSTHHTEPSHEETSTEGRVMITGG